MVNSSQGGGTRTLGAGTNLMLSRNAETCSGWRAAWSGRRIPRACSMSAPHALLPSTIDKQALHFEPIFEIAPGSVRRLHEPYDDLTHETIIRYVALEPEIGGSIGPLTARRGRTPALSVRRFRARPGKPGSTWPQAQDSISRA